MKLEEALLAYIQKGDPQFYRDARFTIYGSGIMNAPEPNAEARRLLSLPSLQGDDFEYIGQGGHGFVFGNDKIVIKFGENHESHDDHRIERTLQAKDIPEGLAAKVYEDGYCNGMPYSVGERLDTSKTPTLHEIVPYLFKCRDKGLVYWDPRLTNFGHDAEGNIKAIDMPHFKRADDKSFACSLRDAIWLSDSRKFPEVFSDDKYTYAVLAKKPESSEFAEVRKQLMASLNAVGIEGAESIPETTLIRIPATTVKYGLPPQVHSLTEYLRLGFEAHAGRERAESGMSWPDRGIHPPM